MLAAGFVGEDMILAEDRLRADQYQLFARFLAAPAEPGLLQLASGFTGDDTEYGRALGELADRAGRTTPKAASREYHDLFIGIGRGELVPYASYYLSGFLNEKPLARLRGDMARLGIARAETVKEPEDHIAALCEMMAGRSLTAIWPLGRRCSSKTWRRRGRRGSTRRSARSAGCSWASKRPPSRW
jgi:hypothetical protein